MALPSYLSVVQGSRNALGPDTGWEESFLVVPGTNDYVVGGYPITNVMTRCKIIADAWLTMQNPLAGGYDAFFNAPLEMFKSLFTSTYPEQGTNDAFPGYSTVYFQIFQSGSSAGREPELAAGTNLLGCVWQVRIRSY